MEDKVLLSLQDLSKNFHVNGGTLKAVNHVNFDIKKGETVGLVGESGCGKSTLGRTVMGIYSPTSGKILYDGEELHVKSAKDRLDYAKKAQMIFQDPYASLNPRMTVGDIIAEGMEIHKMYDADKRKKKVQELLELVGLNKEHANRFEPEFLVCDEPISALDVSIQSQVINLLIDLQKELGLTYLFIAHDLDIVRYISDRIVVMYLGHVVEIAEANEVYNHALHPYSQALLSAVPIPDPDLESQKQRIILQGDVPSPINLPDGCPFVGRCSRACDKCHSDKPQLVEVEPNHFVACHNIEK